MGKSSKKSSTKVEAAPAAAIKPLKKGKRDAEDDLDIQVNPKKQKTELIAAVQKEIAPKKKVETSSSSDSSDSSDSEEDEKIVASKKPEAKIASVKAKAESSSEEDSSSDDEEPAPAAAKKQPETVNKAKAESSSSEDESSSDEEVSAPAKKQPVAIKKAESESSSDDDSSSDEESAPAKKQPEEKQPVAIAKAEAESSSSEDESSSSSDEESAPAKKQPVAIAEAKAESSSSEDESSSSDEESDDEKPPTKKANVSSTETSKPESSSEESDDEESEDEKLTPKKKDSDTEMVEAEQKSIGKQPKTPTTQTQGRSKTLFAGNLSFKIEKSDVENFFKGAGEVVDVRFASHEDGNFKGFGHVEFVSGEAALKALKLNGKTLLGREIKLDLAREKGAYNSTPRSSNASGNGRAEASQFKTIFVKGFDSSLSQAKVRDALREHFSTCGEITRITVPIDQDTGAVRGSAFIDLKDGFKKALELSGSELGGRRIQVNEARPRADNSGGRDDGGRFSNRRPGRGDEGGRFSRARFSPGRSSFIGRTPSKPSIIHSAQGKKKIFDDDE